MHFAAYLNYYVSVNECIRPSVVSWDWTWTASIRSRKQQPTTRGRSSPIVRRPTTTTSN